MATVAVVASLAAGCGDDDGAGDGDGISTTTSSTTSSSTTPSSTTPSSTTSSSTTSSVAPPPTTPIPDADLPGTDLEVTPAAGQVLSVVGVAHDDVLHVRRAPGTDQEIVADLANLADDFVATGRGRMLTRSIWWEVTTTEGIIGWVGSSFTAITGPTSDTTAEVVSALGKRPETETMVELGTLVAETLRPDPDMASEIVLVVAPTVGDLGEITYDLVGLGDDAVRARRLHVFGQPSESGEGFVLRTVEATDMCEAIRGVSQPEGLCA